MLTKLLKYDMCAVCTLNVKVSSSILLLNGWKNPRWFSSFTSNAMERSLGQPTFFTHPYLMKEGKLLQIVTRLGSYKYQILSVLVLLSWHILNRCESHSQ